MRDDKICLSLEFCHIFLILLAIYYFVQEYQTKLAGGVYKGEFDDLLYFFSYTYELIQKTYKDSSKDFWRIKNYVKSTEQKQ